MAAKVLNKYSDDCKGGIYIGRPTKWGNPFVIGRDGDRDEVVKKYEAYIRSKPILMDEVKMELKGKNLICFCAPKSCHGDVLLRIANED